MKTLIIDRVKVFKQLIAGILDDSSIEHVFAGTGEEALSLLEADAAYDCICLALYLDDMDGFELSKKIRKIAVYKHVPIVLLTSENSAEVMKQAINVGITDMFSKNKIHELVNFIERFTQVNQPLSGQVLYIEDQQSQRDLVTAMFKQRNLEVDAFDNAEAAWQAFMKKRYHLVVTDIVLAGTVSGVFLINKIRRLDGPKGDTPILAVTAFDDNSRRISLYHMGITDYVTKPIIEEELIARVRNLIANQKALEREIEFRERLNSEDMIRRSMKMEAMGKLTGGIAHDYNNMLGVIMGYTDLLTRKFGDNPKLQRYVSQIERASANGAKLTRKLLSFTKKESNEEVTLNINKIITDTESMLEKILTSAVRLELNLENDLWNVHLDANDLENALLNMGINAKHAMPEKGVLTLITMNKSLSPAVADKLGLESGDYVRLSVLDNGSGMDKETQARIFDPFYSTKGDAGTGLGLSQVYGFSQRSHGTISVESKPGKGTLFNLYFPRVLDVVRQDDAKQDKEAELVAKKAYSILVVDDEDALAELNAEIIENAGYEVKVSHDAAEALVMLKSQSFDLVFSDVVMPGMNGYELASKIRRDYPDTKVIISSGYDESIRFDGVKEGVCDKILEKPVSRVRLLESLSLLLS